jgi:hypothetical protein
MGLALLLLGLLPFAFMPDFLGDEDTPEDEPASDNMGSVGQGDLLGGGGLDAAGGAGQGTGIDLISGFPGGVGGGAVDGGGMGGGDAAGAQADPGQADEAGQLDQTEDQDPANDDADASQSQPDGGNTLQPVNEIDQADAGTQNVDPGAVLQPVDQIDVGPGQDASGDTVLTPVNPIDTAADEVWVNYDDVDGTGHAEIDDFKPGEDVLQLSVSANRVSGAPEVQVTPSADGQDGLVFVEKQLMVVLKGAAGASADDIRLDAETESDDDSESESESDD